MKFAPLPGTFMITAMVGLIISIMYIMKLDLTWGFTFTLVFLLMFIASMVSLSKAASPEEIDIQVKRKK